MKKEFNTRKDILAKIPIEFHQGQFDSWDRFNRRTVEERIAICEDEIELFSIVNNTFFRTKVLTLIELYIEKIHKDHC